MKKIKFWEEIIVMDSFKCFVFYPEAITSYRFMNKQISDLNSINS